MRRTKADETRLHGTPDFARACLETLHTEGFDIVGVYTKVDTPKTAA